MTEGPASDDERVRVAAKARKGDEEGVKARKGDEEGAKGR